MDRRKLIWAATAAGAGVLAVAGTSAPAQAGAPTAAPSGAPAPTPQRPLRVQIVMFDGAEEQDFIGPYEVLLCTGASILAAAGLTTGRPCTTHGGAKAELAARGGEVKNARVVDDGDLVTAGGIPSGLELALHLVRRKVSADVAVRAEEVLEYQARGTVWAR